MGVAKTLVTGGLSNTEILTGVVMPKDFIKAPESVMSAVMTPKTTVEQQQSAASTLYPAAQQPQDAAAGAERAAAQTSQQRQRTASAFGMPSLIGD